MKSGFSFSKDMYERLFKHNIMPLFVCDKTGLIISCNDKFTELTKYSKAEVTNKNFSFIFKPESKEEKQKFSLIEFGFFDQSQAHDVVLNPKKGENRFVRLWIDASFDEDLSLAAVEDYTDKRVMELKLADQNKKLTKLKNQLQDFNKKLEEKVKERTKELLLANKKINGLLERKNQFINELAHDLRTPLTPITYLVESLKDDIKDKASLKDMEIIENNVTYLRNLVEDILKLARIDNNKVEFNFEDASIYEIVNNVINNNKVTLKKLKMDALNKIPKSIPNAYMDRLKITEVLENLVMNSTKFMESGGKLTFSAKKEGKFIEVTVKDTGIGVSKENIDKIFEEFFKADTSRHHHKGHGLGLSICRRIIERHGGKIWAESAGVGKGTSFKFTIKLTEFSNVKKKSKEEPKEADNAYYDKLQRLKQKLGKKGDPK